MALCSTLKPCKEQYRFKPFSKVSVKARGSQSGGRGMILTQCCFCSVCFLSKEFDVCLIET